MPLTLDDIIRVATTHTEQELEGVAKAIEEQMKKPSLPASQQHLIRMGQTRVFLAQYLLAKVSTVTREEKGKDIRIREDITEEVGQFLSGFYVTCLALFSPKILGESLLGMVAKISQKSAGHRALAGYEMVRRTEQSLRDDPSGLIVLAQLKKFPADQGSVIRGIQCASEQYTALYNRFSPAPSAQSAPPQ